VDEAILQLLNRQNSIADDMNQECNKQPDEGKHRTCAATRRDLAT
jgi:hypothetical protein